MLHMHTDVNKYYYYYYYYHYYLISSHNQGDNSIVIICHTQKHFNSLLAKAVYLCVWLYTTVDKSPALQSK